MGVEERGMENFRVLCAWSLPGFCGSVFMAGWSVYAEPEPHNNSARLTFVSPTGNKLKSLKEVQKFLTDTANAPRIPAKGGLIEAEMEDPHEKRMEWVQGTITKVLPKNAGFKVSFKIENAEEKGTWEETYKVDELLHLV